MISISIVKKLVVTLFMILLPTSLSLSSTTLLKGGTICDGLDLATVRVGEHGEYSRMVFNVNYGEGYGSPKANTPADMAGNYIFKLDNSTLTIEATFSGFRSASCRLGEISSQRVKGMSRLMGEEYDDDSSVTYKIKLYKPSKIKAFILDNPSRIILDISDMPRRIL